MAYAKYTKRPLTILAVQWTGFNKEELLGLTHSNDELFFGKFQVVVHTLGGNLSLWLGDWLIKGIKGEVYPCRADIFEETYEKALGNC